MIHIVATFRVRPDAVGEFRALADELVKASRAEDGNLAYDLCVARDDSVSLVVLGTRRNDTTIETHNASARFTTLMPRMAGFCAGPPPVVQYTKIWAYNARVASVTGDDTSQ